MKRTSIEKLVAVIEAKKVRSAWDKGVKGYALELAENLEECSDEQLENICNSNMLRKALLNGASSWEAYSWGGCADIYDGDIAERLCTPSELKRTDYGRKRPNSTENWLDVQTRALYQAASKVCWAYLGHESEW